jgi:hypothetical protein
MTWLYDINNLNSTTPSQAQSRDQTRFLIGDTDPGDQQLQDEEIYFTIASRSSVYGAAAMCCRNLATKFSRLADSAQGPLHTSLSQKARNYRMMAGQYENEAMSRGALPGYAGGISISDKAQAEMDTDRVPPQFNIGMTDNFLPIAPAGNELPDEGADDSQTDV